MMEQMATPSPAALAGQKRRFEETEVKQPTSPGDAMEENDFALFETMKRQKTADSAAPSLRQVQTPKAALLDEEDDDDTVSIYGSAMEETGVIEQSVPIASLEQELARKQARQTSLQMQRDSLAERKADDSNTPLLRELELQIAEERETAQNIRTLIDKVPAYKRHAESVDAWYWGVLFGEDEESLLYAHGPYLTAEDAKRSADASLSRENNVRRAGVGRQSMVDATSAWVEAAFEYGCACGTNILVSDINVKNGPSTARFLVVAMPWRTEDIPVAVSAAGLDSERKYIGDRAKSLMLAESWTRVLDKMAVSSRPSYSETVFCASADDATSPCKGVTVVAYPLGDVPTAKDKLEEFDERTQALHADLADALSEVYFSDNLREVLSKLRFGQGGGGGAAAARASYVSIAPNQSATVAGWPLELHIYDQPSEAVVKSLTPWFASIQSAMDRAGSKIDRSRSALFIGDAKYPWGDADAVVLALLNAQLQNIAKPANVQLDAVWNPDKLSASKVLVRVQAEPEMAHWIKFAGIRHEVPRIVTSFGLGDPMYAAKN